MTEWVRGGQIAWMESIQKGNESLLEKAHQIFLKNGGSYSFASVLLLDSCVIKPVTYGTTIQGSYASLQPTEKGRSAMNLNQSVLLPHADR